MTQYCGSLSIAVLIGICSGGSQAASPTSPTAPVEVSAPAVAQPVPRYTLSGVVFERTHTGTAPIEGVELYCDSCGSPDGHTFVYTDERGAYSFAYTPRGINALLIQKDGYGDPPGQPPEPVQGRPWRQPNVDGDTRFDIELVRR